MTVKAVCTLGQVIPDPGDPTKFDVMVNIAGLDSTTPVNAQVPFGPFAATISAAYLSDDIRDAVKTYLTNNYGYTFSLLDSVRLLGALV